MGIDVTIFLLLLLASATQAFVYPCEEVRYKLLNSRGVPATRYACAYADTSVEWTPKQTMPWRSIYIEPVANKTSLRDLIHNGCVESTGEGPWRIVTDDGLEPDMLCSISFTMLFTSSPAEIHSIDCNRMISPERQQKTTVLDADNDEQVFVEPTISVATIELRKQQCTGGGNVTVFTGAGIGEEEERYVMKTWSCAEFPDAIITFDTVISVKVDDDVNMTMTYQPFKSVEARFLNAPGERVVFMTSGRSDNYYMHQTKMYNTIGFYPKVQGTRFYAKAICAPCSFDPTYNGYLDLSYTETSFYSSKTTKDVIIDNEISLSFEFGYQADVQYTLPVLAPSDLWNSQDNFILEFSFSTAAPDEPTIDPVTTEAAETSDSKSTEAVETTAYSVSSQSPTTDPIEKAGDYCGCALDSKFGMPEGWDPNEIWIDVVIILDTSEAMGEISLVDASNLIESFIGTDDFDVLITDNSAKFYTRIGLIAMSNEAEVIYNLNMTKADKVLGKVHIKTGVTQINVVDAFNAAMAMFNDGLNSAPDRANTRQVIYYMTDSDPRTDLTPMNQFKTDYGIIIVNNFIDNGAAPSPGLKNLASDGYFRYDIQYNYMDTIQLFCKANCYCQPDSGKTPYASQNEDPAVKAAGGCFYAAPIGVPFSKARSNCDSLGGGKIASIHDQNKAEFVQKLMSKEAPKSDYFWIGYSKSESDGQWRWEDQSSDPFTNWDVNEPSTAAVAKCAYVDSTSPELYWGAGNCAVGFPSVCEFAPCAVGNKNC